jgi:uncharacterized membrane protein YfcA
MSLLSALLAVTVVTLGSAVQGSVGIGLGMLGAPLLLLIDPRLVPGPLLVTAGVLITLLARREWRDIRFGDLAWSVPGRVLGTAAAAVFLRVIQPGQIEVALGVMVLLAVGVSASGIEVPLSPRTFLGAGTISGFFGTTTAIGGPPIALLYQRERGPVVRGTLSAFFVFGVVISLSGLALIGRFGLEQVRLSLLLIPGVVVGYALSGRLAPILDRGWTRPAILAASAAAGIIVVVRHLLRS